MIDEIGRHDADARTAVVSAPWISVVHGDSLELLAAYGVWSGRRRPTDDRTVRLCRGQRRHAGAGRPGGPQGRAAARPGRPGRAAGLVADACRRGRCTVTNASVLVDDLHATGMRLPFPRGGSESWAREKKLLG
ncbi:hypothetical protein GCM10022630_01910 [Thermobifida alba]